MVEIIADLIAIKMPKGIKKLFFSETVKGKNGITYQNFREDLFLE